MRWVAGDRKMLNKVPEVTIYFWIIKVLCTTVGETASDYLATNLNLGLTNTTFATGGVLIVVLVLQLRARRYVPGIYWLAVVLISVVGTQITDNSTDNFGISPVTTTVVFSVALAAVFGAWHEHAELTETERHAKHIDLPSRVAHLGLPVTTVVAQERAAAPA